jgi:hypothetical protein
VREPVALERAAADALIPSALRELIDTEAPSDASPFATA